PDGERLPCHRRHPLLRLQEVPCSRRLRNRPAKTAVTFRCSDPQKALARSKRQNPGGYSSSAHLGAMLYLRRPVFAILAPVSTAFYILVILQIVVGLYSLWTGFEWFQMVRRRLGSHAGFYAPVTAVICPCKGNELGLEDNLKAITQFDYPSYEIYFSLATSLDPALKVVERVKAASKRPVHVVIAGPPEEC